MRKAGILGGLMTVVAGMHGMSLMGQVPVSRPNVIIILTDDQGYGDFSANGNPVLRTPNLDSLSGESIRLSDFHVSPLCTPSRGELLSGLDALRNGACTVGTGRDFLRRDIVTLPEVFRAAGYRTGIFGKWHLGDHYPDRPMDRGFEKCVWFRGWGLLSESEFDDDYYRTRYLDSLRPVSSDQYCTDLWFDKAMEWMDHIRKQEAPFFIYLATNAPHGPLYAPKKDFLYYKNQGVDPKTAKFFGMIRDIDRNVGKLDRWLEKTHLRNNTLLIFMNDNGGTAGVKIYNAGMRGQKGSLYDGGHRAVCFISWPAGHLLTARALSGLSEVQDIFPTCLDLCGLNPPAQKLDGISLAPVLRGKEADTNRKFVVQYGGSDRPRRYESCVLQGYWRLVGKKELYNVSSDPGETKNIADKFPDKVNDLLQFYQKWWRGLSPDWDRYLPLVVGNAQENPVILTSDYWADSSYVNTQWKVAQAGGPPSGGVWHISAARTGNYKIELSRWPFRLQRPLTAIGPDTAEGGTHIRPGKAVPVARGCVCLDGKPAIVGPASGTEVILTARMGAGNHTLRAWFDDQTGKAVCGAYYVRMTWMGP